MTKALLKKQMMEVFAWVYRNNKTGKNRSTVGCVVFALFYFVLFVILGFVFYGVAAMLCPALAGSDLVWLYFAIMGLIAIALGVFGSVFNTYASLFQAKDNDLLLSMPIPVYSILITRLLGVYVSGLMYELIVIVPTLAAYFIYCAPGISGVACSLMLPLVLSVFVLTLSCVLSWPVALISSRMKNKNIITVILSLVFIAAYYYLYGNVYSMLQRIVADPEGIGLRAKSLLFPFYHMGLGADGNIGSMLLFSAMVLVLFAIVVFVLARSFIGIATTNRGTAKTKYRAGKMKTRSADSALFRRELRRFLGSANYMLNCGLGIIMMPVAAVALLIKGKELVSILSSVFGTWESAIPLLTTAAVCMLCSMNDISAPSVSLEGKNLWLVRSLPVRTRQVLAAKLNLHLALTAAPAAVLLAASLWVFRPSAALSLLIVLTCAAFILFMALIGLFVNLKTPNLNWTSEVVPIKQSMGVMVALLGGWVLVLVFGGLYILISRFVAAGLYLFCVSLLLLALSAGLLHWIFTKGADIFESL